jgi:hypothetical protein
MLPSIVCISGFGETRVCISTLQSVSMTYSLQQKNLHLSLRHWKKNINFKLRGTGPLQYHLGCDYFLDDNGTICFGLRKYIEKMIEQYERMLGSKARVYTSPLERRDHPEIDTSEDLEPDNIKVY